jgi:hypothetical protein
VAADNAPVPVRAKVTVTPAVAVGNCAEITEVVLMATVEGLAATTNAPAANVVVTVLAELPEVTLTTTSPGAVPVRVTVATPPTVVAVAEDRVPLPEVMAKFTTVPSAVPAGRVAVMVDVAVVPSAAATGAEAAGAVANGVVFGPSSPQPAITSAIRVSNIAKKLFTFMILLLFYWVNSYSVRIKILLHNQDKV